MSNRLEKLHSQCRSYHLKKALKRSAALLLAFGMSVGAYYLYEAFMQEQVIQSSIDKVNATQEMANTETKKQNVPTGEKTLSPSYLLSVSASEVEKSIKQIQNKKSAAKFSEVEPAQELKRKSLLEINEKKAFPQVKEAEVKAYFSDINEDKPLEDWIEKYNLKKSYTIAIYIAKQYYFNNMFKEAGIWAKRANQHDRDKEDAWILYAKSVYAMGDKQKGKKILNIYLQYKESAKAELLLSEWSH